jgi:hygromycin-B 4-O-kinase
MIADDPRIRAFLVARLGAEPESIEPLRPGEWSSVYAMRRRGEDLVVRFSRYRDDFEKDRLVARWSGPALPVPEVLEIGEALGASYAVTPRVRGAFLDELDEAGMRRVLPALFDALDAARLVDLSSTSGFGGWSVHTGGQHRTWREAVLTVGMTVPPGRNEGWRERLEASPTGLGPFEEALARVHELVHVCPEERHLIHDDLLNRNVLVQDDRITAVLDWGSSSHGDFLWDVALLVYGSAWFPAWSRIDFAGEAARHYAALALPVPSFEERLRCYAIRIGLSGMAYSAWKERWDHVAWHAARTRIFAEAR